VWLGQIPRLVRPILIFLVRLLFIFTAHQSTMDFVCSTQAKSWMFSVESLEACRQRAVVMDRDLAWQSAPTFLGRVLKFASGFHRHYQQKSLGISEPASYYHSAISVHDQEILVQFHAHQIQFLVGPSAILHDLRTSGTVVATAITFFRRFFLSNSVVEVNPRRIAVACAFFAAKAEEEKVEVRSSSSSASS
jgi:cyclin H